MPAPLQRFARLAGALYIAMMPFGFFGIVYVPSVLLVPGDAAATLQKVVASDNLLRMGTVSHILGQLIFIFLVLTLFRLLQAVHQPRAVLMVVVALIGVPLTLYNEVNHLTILGGAAHFHVHLHRRAALPPLAAHPGSEARAGGRGGVARR